MEFFKPGKQYNFLGVAGTLTKVSALLVIASWALVATKGLNFGIDFAGGTEALLAFSKPVDIGDLKGEVEKVLQGEKAFKTRSVASAFKSVAPNKKKPE